MNPRDSAQELGTVVGERPPGSETEMQSEIDPPTADPVDADTATDGTDKAEPPAPSSFDCTVCGRSFPFLSSLSQHMRRHTGARPYRCPYCEHRASQKGNLKVHIRSHKLSVLIRADPDDAGEEVEESEMEASGTGEGECEGEAEGDASMSEGLEGVSDDNNSPSKDSSACNGMLNGDRADKAASARASKRERSVDSSPKLLCCRLCGHEVQREDQLISHIEKAHITADVDTVDEPSPPIPATAATATAAATAPPQPDATASLSPAKPPPPEVPEVDGFPCETCGQVFSQAWLLKSHMKKHTGELEHRCRICGRGFREAWFLKSHMKTHTTGKSRGRPRNSHNNNNNSLHNHNNSNNNNGNDHSSFSSSSSSSLSSSSSSVGDQQRATINDVVQDPEVAATVGAICVYEICGKCGNLFHNRQSLNAHSKVHSRTQTRHNSKLNHVAVKDDDDDSPAAKRRLLDYFGLQPKEEQLKAEEIRQKGLGKRVPELDPLCSYQAWQLASKGRVVEPMVRRVDVDLASATVTYDRESSRFVLAGQERRQSRRGSSTGALAGGASAPSPTNERGSSSNSAAAIAAAIAAGDDSLSDSEYRPSSRQERRRSSQSRSHECFECGKVFRSRHQLSVHERSHRREGRGSGGDADSRSPSRPGTPLNDSPCHTPTAKHQPRTSTDEKPYVCSLCDFQTPDSSAFISHLRKVHPEPSAAKEPTAAASKSTPVSTTTPAPTTTSTSSSSTSSRRTSSTSSSTTTTSYPKLKRALLQGASPSPGRTASGKPSTSPNTVIATHARPPAPVAECSEPAVDLCVRVVSPSSGREEHNNNNNNISDEGATVPEDVPPPCHSCAYCAHSTSYPEVLWMHQMIAHRLNSSALVPKWAPRSNAKKSSDVRRRTGPPPALEGKECPPLVPANARSSRTKPPTATTSTNNSSSSSRGSASAGVKRERPSSSSSSLSTSSSSSSSHPHRSGGGGAATVAAKVPRLPSTNRGQEVQQGPPLSSSSSSRSSRPRVDAYPRVASSGTLDKTPTSSPHIHHTSSHHQNHHSHHHNSSTISTPRGGGGAGGSSSNSSPSVNSTSGSGSARQGGGGARAVGMAERFMLPQEGLGFMLTSKHGGFSEYGRPKTQHTSSSSTASPSSSSSSSSPAPRAAKSTKPAVRNHHYHQPPHTTTTSSATSNRNNNTNHHHLHTTSATSTATAAATAAAIANHLYGASQPHGGAALLGLGSPSVLRGSGEVKKQEALAAAAVAAAAVGTQETQLDILSFLKNCNAQELATLYARWGMAANHPLLEHTGLLRSLARQGEYACQECGKSFSQPSHLRTHMRSHTGERPFRCLLCPYGASQKGNLKTHVQSVHHVPFNDSLHLDVALTKMEQLSDSSPALTKMEQLSDSSPALTKMEQLSDSSPALTKMEQLSDSSPALTKMEQLSDSSPALTQMEQLSDSSPEFKHTSSTSTSHAPHLPHPQQ